jgi:hypothetical protein
MRLFVAFAGVDEELSAANARGPYEGGRATTRSRLLHRVTYDRAPMTDEQYDLSTRLTRSSSEFAGSALGAMSDGKHSVFLLHAATALEHLAKAVLATRHPSLIAVASRDNFESLLMLVGEGHQAKPLSRIRTIGAREALDRATRFAPGCAELIDDVTFLVWVRDGIAHLADATAATVDEVLVPYLKTSEELRGALIDVDRSTYWSGFTDLVESALRENVEQARLRVDAKIAVARDEFARRFAEVDEATKKAVVTAIEASYTTDMYELELLECPVCGTMALASGTLKEEFDEDWDHREGVLLNVHVLVLFTPNGLSCRACHLELNGRDEMDAAAMGDAFYLDIDERAYLGASYGEDPGYY